MAIMSAGGSGSGQNWSDSGCSVKSEPKGLTDNPVMRLKERRGHFVCLLVLF